MRIFGSDKLDSVLKTLGLSDGESIQHAWITKALERAQKKVEARNFEIRKSLLKFDDVMNEQRKIIYDQRKEIINEIEIDNLILDMRDSFIEDFLSEEVPDVNILDVNKRKLLIEIAKNELNIEIDLEKVTGKESFEINDIKDELIRLSDHNINIKKTKK